MSIGLIKLKLKNLVIMTVVTFGRKKKTQAFKSNYKAGSIVLRDRFDAIITPQDKQTILI